MNHIQHNMGHYMLPEWLLYTIATIFFAGACFYLYRLLRPNTVKSAYGWTDWENEIGHGLCMLAMASSLAPECLQLPAMFWTVTLSIGGAWFVARALTWGRKLPYNKSWWDWAHVGMLLGMALMFYPLNLGAWFVYVQEAFWLWFTGYYAWQIVRDLPTFKALYLGSDFFHFLMGAVMLLMMLFPEAFMLAHGHDMRTMYSTSAHNTPALLPNNHSAVKQGNTYVVDDNNFADEVLASDKPVVVLFFGGCQKCAQEVHVLDEIASDLSDQAKFVRINKDGNPDACKRFAVTDCPHVFIVNRNNIIAAPSTVDVTDVEQLKAFIANHIK